MNPTLSIESPTQTNAPQASLNPPGSRNESVSRGTLLGIADGKQGVDRYMASIRNQVKMTMLEERGLAERIRAGDNQALNILVTANLKFVVSVCGNYRNRGLPFGDLISEGNLGLMRAAQRFDANLECRFIS